MSNKPLLEVNDLSVSFGQRKHKVQVTYDVSFDICRNRTVALVGESGSGKSVTAMSIIDLLPENAESDGEIALEGQNISSLSKRQLNAIRRSKVSVIFQDPMTALNPVYTIRHLMADAMNGLSLANSEVLERGIELLRQVGIPEPEIKIHQYPHQLSGGQRQRAMIAMAIATNPDVLIADEPTTALDVTVQAEILDLLRELQAEYGMGILLITHDMGVVADIADEVHVMKDGKIVESGETQVIFDSPQNGYTQQLLDAVPRMGARDKDKRAESEDNNAVLEFEHATVEFPNPSGKGSFKAIHDVSFSLHSGEVLGLVGESGSGKSTLGRVAMGLQKLSDGNVAINGASMTEANGKQLKAARKEISVVFQDPASSLDPRVTIGDSIVAPLKWNKILTKKAELSRRAKSLLDMVQIPESWSGRLPHELSGGQRQRVGIARALSLEPSVLIADEPTSALDVSVQAKVLELLQALQRELGFSCLFISHDLAVVELLAKKVIVLRRGEIVESGQTRQVLGNPVEKYTQRLVASAPVPDPVIQAKRRAERTTDS